MRLQLNKVGQFRGVFHCRTTVVKAQGLWALWSSLTPFAMHLTIQYTHNGLHCCTAGYILEPIHRKFRECRSNHGWFWNWCPIISLDYNSMWNHTIGMWQIYFSLSFMFLPLIDLLALNVALLFHWEVDLIVLGNSILYCNKGHSLDSRGNWQEKPSLFIKFLCFMSCKLT